MATVLNLDEELPDKRDEPLTLGDIFAQGVNLADFISDNELNRIGQLVVRDVEIDERSREDWCGRYDRWLEVAMQVRKPKNTPWANASNVKYPLLTTASIQFQARAYPAIVDGSNLVKGRVLGPDPDGTKRERADRIGQHMTWQLLYRMPGWEEDTDKLLLMLPITGTVIRKTFFDSIENANRSEMIPAKDFVINYMAKGLETAPRYTHILHHYPYEVQEKVAAELWRDIRVEADSDADNDDEDALIDFYEQHRTLDLDRDGYPEHYVVTTNKEGEVARIVPCFGPEDVTVMLPEIGKNVKLAELMTDGVPPNIPVKIIRIGRRQYFTKYGFLPAPDGSFYDVGFGALLDDITQSIDTSINQMLDAGALQNAGGGFLGDGVKILGGEKGFRLGEWKRISSPGGLLKDNIVPLPVGGPSAVLFNLLGMLIEGAKDITAVQDVMVGEGTANQPATTTLALIEQGQKVMSGIFKRIHRAFGCELRILRRLNRDYLDEEEYFQLNDAQPEQGREVGPDGQPVMTETGRIGREDYADEDLDVVPVSDPNAVSDMQKMARAQGLLMFLNDPMVNQVEIRRRTLEAMGQRDIKTLLEVPPPAPDPKTVEMGAKLDIAEKDADTKRTTAFSNAAKALGDAANAMANIGLLSDAATLAQVGTELGVEAAAVLENGETNGQPADGGGGIPEMEGQPPDQGIPQLPEGPPVEPGGGMGLGAMPDGGGTGAGGLAGPVGSDQL